MRLQRGIGLERRAGLLGLGEAELGGAQHLDPKRRKQGGDLDQLAGVVAGDDQLAARESSRHYRSAAICSRVSSAIPRARGAASPQKSPRRTARLGGRLDLDDLAAAGQHEIGVGLGRRILGVVEVEHGGAGLHTPQEIAGDAVGERQAGRRPAVTSPASARCSAT
jgi:hypothetical protein